MKIELLVLLLSFAGSADWSIAGLVSKDGVEMVIVGAELSFWNVAVRHPVNDVLDFRTDELLVIKKFKFILWTINFDEKPNYVKHTLSNLNNFE